MANLINNTKQNEQQLDSNFSEKNLIYHCSSFNVGGKGGAENYLTSLIDYQLPGVSDRVITNLKDINQSQFQLLHLHTPDLLSDVTGECPVLYTVHNHSFYCPSGTKYLANQNVICERNFSYLECSWGKIIDGCGTRKPLKVIEEFQRVNWLLNHFKKTKVTFIANSEYVQGELIKNGVLPEQTLTLRCGIPVPKTAIKPLTLEIHKNQRILFVGRIVPDKGLEWLLKTLVYTNPRIKLDIAGEGWDQPRLEKIAKKLGLSNRITWHGWCDSDKLNILYQECFAVIFPSIWPEPAGLVTLESYARYRPVIASNVGGIPEHLQDGKTGILIPASNIQKLADAITELSKNYSKSRTMGEQGYALFTQEFTMDIHVNRIQKIYERMIG